MPGFGQHLLIYRNALKTINGVNDPMLCVSQLAGFDFIITDARSGDNLLLWTENFTLGVWVRSNTAVSPNPSGVRGPYGNNSFLVEVAGASPYFYQEVAVLPNTEYTFSFYVRLGPNPGAFYYSARDGNTHAFLVPETEYTGYSRDFFTRLVETFVTGPSTTRVQLRLVDVNSAQGNIIISCPQFEPANDASAYTATEHNPAATGHLRDDLITMNALLQAKPSIQLGLRVDLARYKISTEVELNAISDIRFGYGSSIQFIWLANADLGENHVDGGLVTRQHQLDATTLIRSANYRVAISADNPLDVFATNQSMVTNLTGASLPMFPGEMFINELWVKQRVCASYIDHISRELLLTSYATDLNIDLLANLTSDGTENYVNDFSIANRVIYQNIANFWGYTAIGYGADASCYATATGDDTLVCFFAYQLVTPTITPAMLRYSVITNSSVLRSDPTGTVVSTANYFPLVTGTSANGSEPASAAVCA